MPIHNVAIQSKNCINSMKLLTNLFFSSSLSSTMTPTRSRRTIRPHWPPGITKKNAAQRIFNIPELVSETVHWQVQELDDFMYKVAGHRGKEAVGVASEIPAMENWPGCQVGALCGGPGGLSL